MAVFDFTGGVAPTAAYGQKSKIRFVQTWANGDTWTIPFASTLSGEFTLGKGNIAGQTYTCAAKLRDRMYLGFSSDFALSKNGDVTLWEEQDSGAAVIHYLSQFGSQDTVKAFASLQGRLVVLGTLSAQIWSVDADPSNMQLLQTVNNTGTPAPLSVQSLGDYDVYYLDYSGVRSMRTKEVTLNAFVNDVGSAIDSTLRDYIAANGAAGACAIIEPTFKQYWLYIGGYIYVLSNYPQSKIIAWSRFATTFESALTPAGNTYTVVAGQFYYWSKGSTETSLTDGAQVLTASAAFTATTTSAVIAGTVNGTLHLIEQAFTPAKFVVYGGQVYVVETRQGVYRRIFRYGGASGTTYTHARATAELPWLDLGQPEMQKQFTAIDAAFKGSWKIEASANPRVTNMTTVVDRGSSTSPDTEEDSTYDIGRFPFSGHGTHIKFKATSNYGAGVAKLGKLAVQYNPSHMK